MKETEYLWTVLFLQKLISMAYALVKDIKLSIDMDNIYIVFCFIYIICI